MADIWDIDYFVDEIAAQPIKKFYPTYIAKHTGVPLPLVFERLLYLVKDGKLTLKWEIKCPNYCCGRVIKTLDYLPIMDESNPENMFCVCGNEVEMSRNIIFPVFEVTPKYRERMKIHIKPKKKVMMPTYSFPTIQFL